MPIQVKKVQLKLKDGQEYKDGDLLFNVDAQAWAKGTRNNVSVTSGDQTYHNNAKYYKDQAANSAIAAANAALTGNLAPIFETNVAYAAGDYVIYNNGSTKTLYRFTQAHAAGSWIGTDAEAVTVGQTLKDFDSTITTTLSDFEDVIDDYIIVNDDSTPNTKINITTSNEDVDLVLASQFEDFTDTALTTEDIDDTLTIGGAAADAAVTGGEIADVKTQINAIDPVVFSVGDAYSANTTAEGYKLKDDSNSVADAAYKLVKYTCTAGDYVRIISDHKFQFQTTAGVPSSGNTRRVGKTYDAGEFYLRVPNTAGWIIVSTTINASTASVYGLIPISSRVTALEGAEEILDGKVSAAESDIDAIQITLNEYNSVIYDVGDVPSAYGTPAQNYKLKDNGLSVADSTYELQKYSCTEGKYYKVVSDHKWQFQKSAGVPTTGTSNRVGVTYGIGTFIAMAPETAKYVIISTTKENSTASIHNVGVLDKRVSELETEVDGLATAVQGKAGISDIRSNMFVSSLNDLDGWDTHAKAFANLFSGATNAEGFMFVTDSHFMAKATESEWRDYMYSIFAYWEQLYYATPCSFFMHGGDWIGAAPELSTLLYKLATLGGAFRSRFNSYVALVGNHDIKYTDGTTKYAANSILNNTLLSGIKNNKNYYVHDAKTFRLYCFDSGIAGEDDAYKREQIKWFADSLLVEDSDNIAIAVHILSSESSNSNEGRTIRFLGDELTKCANAFNARGTYSLSASGNLPAVTASYSTVTGTKRVGFLIAGHTHEDLSGDSNGIPYIITTNNTEYSDTTYSNLPLPLDLIKVDWSANKLTAYRAARGASGSTREITLATAT